MKSLIGKVCILYVICVVLEKVLNRNNERAYNKKIEESE